MQLFRIHGKNKHFYSRIIIWLSLLLWGLLCLSGCADSLENSSRAVYAVSDTSKDNVIDINGFYTSMEDVALYIHTYNRLPDNFITKKQAEALGWQGGGLDDFYECGCIGGNYFGNYEGALPQRDGRKYYECDIDTMHKDKRGSKRIVFSSDGLIYYTEDHYETFELLYGEE